MHCRGWLARSHTMEWMQQEESRCSERRVLAARSTKWLVQDARVRLSLKFISLEKTKN